MTIHLTELILSQAKTLGVMFGAGIVVESLWQIKCRIQQKVKKDGNGRSLSVKSAVLEGGFWGISAGVISMFLYYCAFGKISMHAGLGFLAGLLLWKKICCGIINNVWVENVEAESLKTTARSSISKRPENKGWKKDRQKEKKKKSE